MLGKFIKRGIEWYRNRLLEWYRDEFKRAPLGRWSEIYEYGPWEHHILDVYENGTGCIFWNGDKAIEFNWKESATQEISFCITWHIDDKEQYEPDDEDWETFCYDFKIRDYYGKHKVLYQTPGQTGYTSFLDLGDLEYKGPVKVGDPLKPQ